MHPWDGHLLDSYWNASLLGVNALVFFNILGALVLGLVVGYERSYHGRAAGMRTYGIVCMASAALTVFAGFPTYWYGGQGGGGAGGDPTRLVQGIVTGIGFLGAGVILKDGLNIRGLTTAASIWAASAIGVLVGVGFYAAAILLAALSFALMMWGPKLERLLPHRPALHVIVQFGADESPDERQLLEAAARWGYDIAIDSLCVTHDAAGAEWRFVAIARHDRHAASVVSLADVLPRLPGVARVQLSHARN